MTICDNCVHRNVCADEGHYDEALSFCADKIEERPKGKWIFDGVYRDENNLSVNDIYHCNLCKRSIITSCTRPEDLFPFCHCGADMRGKENEKT